MTYLWEISENSIWNSPLKIESFPLENSVNITPVIYQISTNSQTFSPSLPLLSGKLEQNQIFLSLNGNVFNLRKFQEKVFDDPFKTASSSESLFQWDLQNNSVSLPNNGELIIENDSIVEIIINTMIKENPEGSLCIWSVNHYRCLNPNVNFKFPYGKINSSFLIPQVVEKGDPGWGAWSPCASSSGASALTVWLIALGADEGVSSYESLR